MGRPKKLSPTETPPPNKNIITKIGVRTCIPLNDDGRTFFLEHIRRHPCLWDRKHPHFRQTEDRNQVWTEIGRELYLHSYTVEQAPISKLNNTLTLLKSVYRKKKRMESLTDELLASCSWLKTIDEFLSDEAQPYKYRKELVTSKTNFSLDETLQLLRYYKSNECLWNPKHPMYHNRAMHTQLWKDCAAHMNKNGLTAEHCNKMIKQLRHRYLVKREALRAADIPEFCKKLEWFGLSESFLGPLLFPQGGQSKKVGSYLYSNFGVSVEETIMDEELEPIGPIPTTMRKMSKADKYSMYLRFLKLYQKFEILWNPKHPCYGVDFYRNKAWTFFAELIRIEDITPEYCKEKMKVIRAHYIQRRRQLTAPELELAFLQPEWFSYAESFLGPMIFSTDAERLLEPLAKEQAKEEKANEDKKPLQSELPPEHSLHANDDDEDEEQDEDSLPLSKFQVSKTEAFTDRYPEEVTKHEISDNLQNDDDIPHYTETISLQDPRRLDEVRLRLMSLYKHFELLWNSKHKNYNATRLRHKAWQVFTEQTNIDGLTVEETKQQIRTARKLYREMKKDDQGKKPQWFYVADSYLAPTGEVQDCGYAQSEDRKFEILDDDPQYTETLNLNDRVQEVRLRLLKLYKHYELLWNSKHKSYSATPQRHKAWKKFAQQAKIGGLTVEESKKQIWAARRSYKKIKLKVQAGTVVDRQPHWYYVADSIFGSAMGESQAMPCKRCCNTPNASPDLLDTDEVLPEFIAVTGTADDLQIKKEDLDFTTELTDTCCRACLQDHYKDQSFLKGLTTTIIDGVQLQQIYNECVGSAYEDVNSVLPDSICKSCFHLIIDFYQFRNKCLVNEMKFLVAKNVDLQKKTTGIMVSCPTKPGNNTTQSAINEEEDDSFMNFADDDDSFTWEETPIVEHPKTVKEEPTTSTFNFEDLIKKEMPTTSKMSENLDKKIVEVRFGKKRETRSQNAAAKKRKSATVNEKPVKELTIMEVAEKFTALDFDGENLDFDNFFDDVCDQSELIDNSLIVKHDKVITEETTASTEVREKKEKKPAEQVEKEELLFADYLKKMLEEAKKNPGKIGKKPKLSHHDSKDRRKRVCSLCGITTVNIYQHMKTHQEAEKLHCNLCNRKRPFKHELQLEEHMRRVHREHLYMNKCKICDISFLTRQERTLHVKNGHPEIKCDVCSREYRTPYLMQVHRNSVHVIERNEDGTPLQCSVCEKDFRNYTLLNQHRRRVHVQKKFDCDRCDYTAKQLRQLKRHQYAKHTDNVVKYICHICEKSFLHLHYLKNHFMLRHIEEQKYKCHLCTDAFKYNARLRKHLGSEHPEFQLPPKGETIINN